MESTPTALWQRLPQARITLAKALDLYEAANRARNLSPRSVAWYRQRLEPFRAQSKKPNQKMSSTIQRLTTGGDDDRQPDKSPKDNDGGGPDDPDEKR